MHSTAHSLHLTRPHASRIVAQTWVAFCRMSDFPSAAEVADVVASLRAAGCVFAEDEADLLLTAAESSEDLHAKVAQRVAGLPVEQVVGWAEFHGLRIIVEPDVFVPRRRTEFLVDQALALLDLPTRPDRHGPPPVVLDLCCGSGALGAAVASALAPAAADRSFRSIDLHAADVHPAAVSCARRNLAPFGGKVYRGDLFDALPGSLRGRIDLLVVNAPYVPTEAIDSLPAEARLYEPLVTLDGGPDGLDVQRRVVAGASTWLVPGGHLLIETSERQCPATVALLVERGLTPQVARLAELDATVVIGRR